MATIDDIGVPGQPLGSPPLTEWMDAVRDGFYALQLRHGAASKGTDQSGIASGGSAGFTASLSGVLIGKPVLGLISANIKVATTPSSVFVAPTWTGGTVTLTNGPEVRVVTSDVGVQAIYFGMVTATSSTVTLTFGCTQSNASAWTCIGRSSILLLTPGYA